MASCWTVTDPAYLIDSNILLYVLAGSAPLASQRIERMEPGSLCTSTICLAEIEVGLGGALASERHPLLALLRLVPALPLDAEAAAIFGRLAFRRGRFDRLIAAHALALGLTLITNNEADFADIPSLRVENWTRP